MCQSPLDPTPCLIYTSVFLRDWGAMKPGGRVIKTLTSGKRYFKAFQKQQKKLESIRQRNFRFSRCKITIDRELFFSMLRNGRSRFFLLLHSPAGKVEMAKKMFRRLICWGTMRPHPELRNEPPPAMLRV